MNHIDQGMTYKLKKEQTKNFKRLIGGCDVNVVVGVLPTKVTTASIRIKGYKVLFD